VKVIDAAAKLTAARIRDLKSTVDSYPRDVHGSGRPMGRIGSGQYFCKLR